MPALAALGWADLNALEVELVLVLAAEHLKTIAPFDRPLPFALAKFLRMPLTPSSTHAVRQALDRLARLGLLDHVAPRSDTRRRERA